MNRQPDAEGKYPLSGREYYALRQLFGIASGFETTLGDLKDRAKLTPGTWRDMKMISAVSDKAITALVRSIPTRKLQQVLKELENTVVSVEVRGGAGLPVSKREPFCYAPEKSIELLIQSTLEWQCFACEKSPKQAKKCPYRKAIDDVFPYEQPGDTPELCKYSGLNLEVEYEEADISKG